MTLLSVPVYNYLKFFSPYSRLCVFKSFNSSSKKFLEDLKNSREEKNRTSVAPLRFIETLTLKHMPKCGSRWQDVTFKDTNVKAQMLLSCEKAFNRSISDGQLGSIVTVNDVIKIFESPQQLPSNPRTPFPTVDMIRAQDELPHNLSFPEVTEQSSVPKRTRIPFQNFDSPEHANFLSKQQKEARKKKRRHLTSWK